MKKELKMGAMLEIPVECLGMNYKELIKGLTVDNPEAKTQAFFGSKFSQNKVPSKLYFFDTNSENKSILVPRNIDSKYIPFADGFDFSGLARGREISEGVSSSFKLRPHQFKFFDEVVIPYINSIIIDNNIYNNINNIDILIDAECGSGKTVISLYLASIYKRNVLVGVTKRSIGDQFIKTVKELFPQWSVGWENGKDNFDITVATYSLLSGDTYDGEYFDKFGHLIMDEYHRAGASTYQTILAKATCQYRTTLTATFRRKDGLQKILGQHIGHILTLPRTSRKAVIYPILTGQTIHEINYRAIDKVSIKVMSDDDLQLPRAKREKLARLEVYTDVCVKHAKTRQELVRGMVTDIDITKSPREVSIMCGNTGGTHKYFSDEVTFHKLGIISTTAIDTEITEFNGRNDIVLNILKSNRESGRKTLILSKRKEVLYKMYYRLKRYGFNVGIVISEKAKDYTDFCKKIGVSVSESREYALKEADVVLGIDKLAEEGLDIPHIDSLIFLHPVKDIEQAVGRITRELENKPSSQAFYLVDNFTAYRKAWDGNGGAKKLFLALGHKVKSEMTFDEYINNYKDEPVCSK